uniref:CUB domain-containing protein n=1 Tax=Panagrolaimus sp. ES5 TaxID=591445 RepID=A0AC34FDE6_9BILA
MTDLKIENSTDIIWTQHNVKPFHPYYNVDKYLQISLSLGGTPTEMEFSAYITIVKKEWNNTECTVIENPKEIYTPFEYPNNALCKFELTIPPMTEVLFNSDLDFEKGVDYLQYFDGGEKYLLDSETVLFGYKNDTNKTDKNISFELISDGSINKGGFYINFEYIKCECANSKIIIDCDELGQEYYLMKFDKNETSFDNIMYYCGNLNCNFTIIPDQKCPDKFISMEMRLTFHEAFFDSFRIYTNNTVTTEIAFLEPHVNGWFFNTIFSPYVENIFEAITQPSTDISKTLQLIFIPINAPEIETAIILTSEMQYYNAKLLFNSHLVSAELSSELLSQGYTMEIYGQLQYATFYEKENMAHKIALNLW